MQTSNLASPSTSRPRLAAARADAADTPWTPLYRIAGVAALVQIALIAVQIPVYILHPPPETVADFFALFQRNWLLGLLNLDALMMANALLMFPLLLALYVALRRTDETLMALALTAGVVANALAFVWNASFTMLALSNDYAKAATETERAMFLGAGQALLTTHMGGTAFNVYYVLGGVTFLLIAAVMLRDDTFGKGAAYVGLLAGVTMLVPPTVGAFGLYLSLVSLIPMVIWCVLVARRFFELR